MKPFEQQTYYELLEIPVTAPDDEIRAAYERALETYSPDSVAVYALVDPGQLDALRARLTEAMEILTEPDLRAEYDRMIGVSRAGANTVVAPVPSLVSAPVVPLQQPSTVAAPEPTPARQEEAGASLLRAVTTPASSEALAAVAAAPAQSEAPAASTPAVVAPAQSEAPAPSTPPGAAAAVAPSEVPATATPSAPTAPVSNEAPAAAETSAAPSAPTAVPASPEQLVLPGVVVPPSVATPGQIHPALGSYAISYVPVLVPAPSLGGSAFLSPFTIPVTGGMPPGQEAPREARPSEAAPSTPPAAPAPEAPAAHAPAPSPAPAPATPAAAAVAEPPARLSEPTPGEAIPEKPAASAVLVHHEEDELSGVRAPLPSHSGTRSPVPSRMERPARPVPTPPPLPPGSRRPTRPTPAVPQAAQASEPGKGSSRTSHPSGMNLEEAQQLAQESAIATAEAALAQVHAKAREPRPKPIELPPHTEFNGELLRRVRESRGLTLQQLAERTRISTKHLENVEADRYAALPATVYLRGILMNIARELVLDPLRVSRSYLALAAEPKKK
jgi:hypothetical protein